MTNTINTNDKMAGAIAYMGWWVTGFFLLFTEKKNSYVRFHAMQSVLIFGSITLLLVVFKIVPIIGWILDIFLSYGIKVIAFILWLVLMWKAYNGEKYHLPYFGKLAQKQLEKIK